jgi:hypothetical protein
MKGIPPSLLFLISLLSGSTVVATIESMDCHGDLSVFIGKKNNLQLLNKLGDGFAVTSNETGHVIIAIDPKKPFVTVNPWNGIRRKVEQVNFEKDFRIRWESDERSSFRIQVEGRRTGFSSSLYCKIRPKIR